jgi:putative NADH-flavin reductase
MKMSVILASGEVGTIIKDNLDDSIREKKLLAFLRSSRWVQIDRDPIRKEPRLLASSGKRDSKFVFKGSKH